MKIFGVIWCFISFIAMIVFATLVFVGLALNNTDLLAFCVYLMVGCVCSMLGILAGMGVWKDE